jgi:hypothetical protein
MAVTITKHEEYGPNYLIVYTAPDLYRVVIRRVRKEEQMDRRLTLSETLVAVLLLAALIWAAVQVGPTAIERWF